MRAPSFTAFGPPAQNWFTAPWWASRRKSATCDRGARTRPTRGPGPRLLGRWLGLTPPSCSGHVTIALFLVARARAAFPALGAPPPSLSGDSPTACAGVGRPSCCWGHFVILFLCPDSRGRVRVASFARPPSSLTLAYIAPRRVFRTAFASAARGRRAGCSAWPCARGLGGGRGRDGRAREQRSASRPLGLRLPRDLLWDPPGISCWDADSTWSGALRRELTFRCLPRDAPGDLGTAPPWRRLIFPSPTGSGPPDFSSVLSPASGAIAYERTRISCRNSGHAANNLSVTTPI